MTGGDGANGTNPKDVQSGHDQPGSGGVANLPSTTPSTIKKENVQDALSLSLTPSIDGDSSPDKAYLLRAAQEFVSDGYEPPTSPVGLANMGVAATATAVGQVRKPRHNEGNHVTTGMETWLVENIPTIRRDTTTRGTGFRFGETSIHGKGGTPVPRDMWGRIVDDYRYGTHGGMLACYFGAWRDATLRGVSTGQHLGNRDGAVIRGPHAEEGK